MKLNHEEVMAVIPHRDPMLLIDEVSHLVPSYIIYAFISAKYLAPIISHNTAFIKCE